MRALIKQFKKLARDEHGGAVIEYGLIVSLLVLGLIAAITSIGEGTEAWVTAVSDGWGG